MTDPGIYGAAVMYGDVMYGDVTYRRGHRL
jgi:hypothetical protein